MYEMMKTLKRIIGLGLAVATGLACSPSGKDLKTETFEFADSTAHAHLTIKAELPVAAKGAPGAIRTKLIEVMDRQLSHIRNRQIGFIFQGYNLIPALTAVSL